MEKNKIPDDVVLVGSKPYLTYINSVHMIFEKFDIVKIMARGQSIPNQIKMVNKLLKNYNNQNIKIDKIEIEDNKLIKEDKEISVPSLIITLKK